jgi:hypothetical protein
MLFADTFPLRQSTETPSWQASAKRKRHKEEKQQFKIAVEQYYEVTLLVVIAAHYMHCRRYARMYVLQAVLLRSFHYVLTHLRSI